MMNTIKKYYNKIVNDEDIFDKLTIAILGLNSALTFFIDKDIIVGIFWLFFALLYHRIMLLERKIRSLDDTLAKTITIFINLIKAKDSEGGE